MKCPQCVANGNKSIVYTHGGSSTLLSFTPYYDEEGLFHNHDPNVFTNGYSCNKGHKWSVKALRPCLNCDYGQETDAEPMECPECKEVQLELRSIDIKSDGTELKSYECINCYTEVIF